MAAPQLPVLEFIARNYRNFNARATRDATFAYWDHVKAGGRMYWAMAGAMSSAQLGITLAPAIRAGLVHGLSVTGDVYDLLKAFGVTCPALQHAVKKLLCAGLRGAKSAEQDIEEAILSCRRAIELLEFDL